MTPNFFSGSEGHIPINIKSSTYDRLKIHKKEHESWNSLIRRILDEWEKLPA